VLIIFDLLLVVVLGLLLYAISARDPATRPGLFDKVAARAGDHRFDHRLMVLLAITGRITEWGFTPTRPRPGREHHPAHQPGVVGMGCSSASCLAGCPSPVWNTWQTRYLIVYAVWAWTVVLAFPLVFDFA
jgi:hypothetical protein